jgi:hypothetical protein
MNGSLVDQQELKADPAENVCVFPLSFAQQSLWLIDQIKPHGWNYNIPCALGCICMKRNVFYDILVKDGYNVQIPGSLDVGALARSFSFLIGRHEVLRTFFRTVNGEPMQFIAPARPMS